MEFDHAERKIILEKDEITDTDFKSPEDLSIEGLRRYELTARQTRETYFELVADNDELGQHDIQIQLFKLQGMMRAQDTVVKRFGEEVLTLELEALRSDLEQPVLE